MIHVETHKHLALLGQAWGKEMKGYCGGVDVEGSHVNCIMIKVPKVR